jgi:hypothetical protein
MRTGILFFLSLLYFTTSAQEKSAYQLKIVNERQQPLANATVELLRFKDSALVKIQMSDSAGTVLFSDLEPGSYFGRVTLIGFAPHATPVFQPGGKNGFDKTPVSIISMQAAGSNLAGITVTTRKPFIELHPDKTVVNVEASVTSIGATALEALEKMPGITVDREGNISLKGRPGVLVLIDGKPTYMSGTQLQTVLSGMSASQISQVELMDQPSSKYEAAGNAGVINIKTKKTIQRGFNGTVSSNYGQGFYPKNNNSLLLNVRQGRFNIFLNYNNNFNQSFTRLSALRTYLDQDGSVVSLLEQPSFFKSTARVHAIRAGADYFINSSTTIGTNINTLFIDRVTTISNPARWMNAGGEVDSLILTKSDQGIEQKNYGINFNFRHQFDAKRELTADVDMLDYRMSSNQFFENFGIIPTAYIEASRAEIPTKINIVSGKADYAQQLDRIKWEAGWKSSHINTDNLADFQYRDVQTWKQDLGRTNHFLYKENIHAAYSNLQTAFDKWSLQGGLRYEMTNYSGRQLGNAARGDSSFNRSYNSLFPTFFAGYKADSLHSFNISAGRRIDRPAFQKLNPFLSIINKYTYQAGNPYFRPQYTWNFKFSHLYKELLVTSVSYSVTKDYFSQIFPRDSNGIIIYTEGNLGRLQVYGISVGLQLSPAKWWSLSANAVYNHKKMEGVVWQRLNASINQLNLNVSNQFRFNKGWSGEVSGFYTSRSQNDIQELLDPSGQLSIGIGKQVLKNKGTVRLAMRDLFYTQWMKGFTWFQGATESFRLERDTRVVTIALTYRFGKVYKVNRRTEGASAEEAQRAG